MPIKSFRGLIKHGTQQIINLHTNDGKTGYRIVKFQVMPFQMGVGVDSCVKVHTVDQMQGNTLTTNSEINFSDNTLLAVGTYYNATYEVDQVIIFDNTIINQDIYVTHHESTAQLATNYHIELEQITLALDQNTVATLKDIRNIESQ